MSDATRQTCKSCDRPDKFDFSVPDDVWKAVVPEPLWCRVVCLFCFDGFAREKDVDYAGKLTTLFFAGDRAVFHFRVVSSTSL